jgi:transposase InsO family protein
MSKKRTTYSSAFKTKLVLELLQNTATQWMWVYNNVRPHSSIGGIPPRKLLEAI